MFPYFIVVIFLSCLHVSIFYCRYLLQLFTCFHILLLLSSSVVYMFPIFYCCYLLHLFTCSHIVLLLSSVVYMFPYCIVVIFSCLHVPILYCCYLQLFTCSHILLSLSSLVVYMFPYFNCHFLACCFRCMQKRRLYVL